MPLKTGPATVGSGTGILGKTRGATGGTTGRVGDAVVPPPPDEVPPVETASALTDATFEADVSLSLHVAVTVKLYSTPAVSPETTQEVVVPVHDDTPSTLGEEVTA